MAIKDVKDFHRWIGFPTKKQLLFYETFEEDLWLLATKLKEKIAEAPNVKQYYQTILKNKNKKSVKQ